MKQNNTEDRTKLVLAVILIAVGLIWLLHLIGIHFHMQDLFYPFVKVIRFVSRILFSWPMILVIAGFVMVAGQRGGGWILVALGGLFMIPRILNFYDFSYSLIFPLILILVGVAMVIRCL